MRRKQCLLVFGSALVAILAFGSAEASHASAVPSSTKVPSSTRMVVSQDDSPGATTATKPPWPKKKKRRWTY